MPFAGFFQIGPFSLTTDQMQTQTTLYHKMKEINIMKFHRHISMYRMENILYSTLIMSRCQSNKKGSTKQIMLIQMLGRTDLHNVIIYIVTNIWRQIFYGSGLKCFVQVLKVLKV